ncbi:MAG: ACP S-malonyltransferase [Candidatus Omnitrophica bacterium]|nr:ACP S-malonyltransferase [Candidatus Omnitrophota bacterium]
MKTVLLFPGQGSQKVGMGRELYQSSPAVRRLYCQADEILGRELSRIIFEGPEEVLVQTENSQPAIYLTGFACFLNWKEDKELPVAAAGHSLGEYTALTAAGVFSFTDGLLLVSRRAELMAQATRERPGVMAAVLGLDDEKVITACAEVGNVWPANYNAPGQVVISGEKSAVEQVRQVLSQRHPCKVIPLKVSGAFHSPLMDWARNGFEKIVSACPVQVPAFPVYANVTGRQFSGADEIKQLLVEQVISPVLWRQTVAQIWNEKKPDSFLEAEPGRVLSGLMKRIVPEANVL